MKILLLLVLIFLPGCVTNLAWRGVVVQYHQEATTEGKIANQPKAGDNSIAAEKTTDLKADVPLTK
jgi:hypothetical protein